MTMQAKHRARTPRRALRTMSGAVLAGAFAATSLAVASPASAVLPESALVTASDENVKARCQFTVTSANYAAGTVRGRLTAQTAPADWTSAANIAHLSINCYLLPQDYAGNTLASIHDEDDGPYTYETELVTVPLFPSYELCVVANYTLRNGDTHQVANCT